MIKRFEEFSKKKANPISTRKSWSKDEKKILGESFPELTVTKESKEKNTEVLSPLKASPRQISTIKVRRLKREKQVMFKKRGGAERVELWK